MSKILSPESDPTKAAVELDPEVVGWLLIQFHPQKGFCMHSGGEIPADQLHFQLEVLQQKLLAVAAMREAQQAQRDAATRIQPATCIPRSPFGG